MTDITEQTRTARLSQSAVNIGGVVSAIALNVCLGFILWALCFVEIPQPNVQLLTLVLGGILAADTTMVNYYFSGNQQSAKSTDSNNKLATANASLANTVAATTAAAPSAAQPAAPPATDPAPPVVPQPGAG